MPDGKRRRETEKFTKWYLNQKSLIRTKRTPFLGLNECRCKTIKDYKNLSHTITRADEQQVQSSGRGWQWREGVFHGVFCITQQCWVLKTQRVVCVWCVCVYVCQFGCVGECVWGVCECLCVSVFVCVCVCVGVGVGVSVCVCGWMWVSVCVCVCGEGVVELLVELPSDFPSLLGSLLW